MLRQRDRHNSAINNQYQQKLPLRVGHQEDQVAKLAADHSERKEHLRIKMAEAEHMERKITGI